MRGVSSFPSRSMLFKLLRRLPTEPASPNSRPTSTTQPPSANSFLIHGRELFVNRKNKSITISTVANALARIKAREAAGEAITGPKKIGCYGASYLYPVFLQLGIIHLPQTNDEPLQ